MLSISKEQVVQQALELGLTTILVNATIPGVVIPSQFLGEPGVRLNLSRNFGVRLELTPDGIYTELSFSGESHDCFIPWKCIWGVVDKNKHMILFEDAREKNLLGNRTEFIVLDELGEVTPPRKDHFKLLN